MHHWIIVSATVQFQVTVLKTVPNVRKAQPRVHGGISQFVGSVEPLHLTGENSQLRHNGIYRKEQIQVKKYKKLEQ